MCGNAKTEQHQSFLVNMLIMLVCVATLLALAEMYFRATTPYIIRSDRRNPLYGRVSGDYAFFMDTVAGRRLIPNTHIIYVLNNIDTKIDINSQGFRGADFPSIKPDGETRVIVLGDSITFGRQVPQEETYVERASMYLQKSEHQGIRLINAGVDGVGIKDEVDILVSQGLKVSPDIVVVGFYLNDGNPPDRFAAELANPNFLRRHSVLAQTVYRLYKQYQYPRGETEGGCAIG